MKLDLMTKYGQSDNSLFFTGGGAEGVSVNGYVMTVLLDWGQYKRP